MISAVIANSVRDPNQRAFTVDDFMPQRADQEQSPEAQADILKLMAAATLARAGGDPSQT